MDVIGGAANADEVTSSKPAEVRKSGLPPARWGRGEIEMNIKHSSHAIRPSPKVTAPGIRRWSCSDGPGTERRSRRCTPLRPFVSGGIDQAGLMAPCPGKRHRGGERSHQRHLAGVGGGVFSRTIGAARSIRIGHAIAARHFGHLGRCLIQCCPRDRKIGGVNGCSDLTPDEQ